MSNSNDSPDTPAQQAFRRGLAAGYSNGVVDGWDECLKIMRGVLDVVEPNKIKAHREVTRVRRQDGERA